jgi:hypothetical protein
VCSPQAGLVGPPNEEVPGALQNVSSRLQSLYHEFFYLLCLLTSIMSSRRHADTNVLSFAPLKRLAQSARVVPSKPCPQPPCAELLPVQVEEGSAVATTVEESGAPPPLVTAAAVEEERMVAETTALQAALEPPPGLARVARTW